MLVVMHYRNVQFFFQTLFYLEALRSLDVFQVDTSESWGNGLYGFNEFIRIFFVYLNVEYVDARIDFKQ